MKKRLLSLVLAVVMMVLAIPTLALPLLAVVAKDGTTVKDTFDLASDFDLDCTTNSKDTSILKLYKWYFADGTPVNGESTGAQAMNAECYATYHPDLIAQGVFSVDDSYETILEKYAAYLKSKGNVIYPGNWELGNVVLGDGTYNKIDKRLLSVTQSIYSARYNGAGNLIVEDIWYEENFRLTIAETGWAFIDAMIEKAKDAVQVGEDGKIFLPEIEGDVLGASFISSSNNRGSSVWYDGGYFWNPKLGAFHLNGIADPSDGVGAAYTYNVPARVDGQVKLSVSSLEFPYAAYGWGQGNSLYITKNGEIVWPADAVEGDPTTFYAIPVEGGAVSADELAKLNEALASANVSAKTGDQISFVFTRTGGRSSVSASPSVEYEEKLEVKFQDKNEEDIYTCYVDAGAAMPKAPYDAGEAGFLVNGVAGALPATVTEDLVIKYAGDYVIAPVAVENVSMSIASDFAVNLFVKPDAYATKVGVAAPNGYEYFGKAQEDGTWKVTIPGFAAKDLADVQELWLFQEFIDEESVENEAAYELTPTEVLAAYADSDATDGMKKLAAAALDYAKAAKAYFDGEALDADVAARLAAQDAAIAALDRSVEFTDGEDYAINGMTLLCRDQVGFKARVMATSGLAIGEEALGYSIYVESDSFSETYTGFVYSEDGELTMVISLNGVAAADFDAVYQFTVVDENGFNVSETFEYSVNDYIARTFKANAKSANVLRAIYALGVAANNA